MSASLYFDDSSSDEDELALDELSGADPLLKARLKSLVLDQRARSRSSHQEQYESDVSDEEEVKQPKPGPKQANPKQLSAVTKLSIEQKIEHTLRQFSAVFSQIFQAILVLMDEVGANKLSPDEEEKVGKRSREFEVRLNRLTFEMKQKVHLVRAATVKLRLTPSSVLLASQADNKLYGALRCGLSLLRSYLAHLPLSGGRLCPDALDNANDALLSMAEQSRQLGYEAEELTADLKRLQAASAKFHSSKRNDNSNPPTTPKKKSPKKKPPPSRAPINLINNLAREKFGVKFPVPQSPKRANSVLVPKQKVIIPRGNAVLRDRAERARRMRDREVPADHKDEAPGYKGALSGHKDHVPGHKDAPPGHKDMSNQPNIGHARRSRKMDEPAVSRSNEPMPCEEEKRFLNLADDELDHILRFRKREGGAPLPRSIESASMICQLSSDVVSEIIQDVAAEMINQDVVEKLLKCELRG